MGYQLSLVYQRVSNEGAEQPVYHLSLVRERLINETAEQTMC